MADLTGICAGPLEAKTVFLDRVQEIPDPFEGLLRGKADLKGVSVLWAAPSPTRARNISANTDTVFTLGAKSGEFWVSVEEGPEGTVTIRTDWLGLFPLYYHATPERLIFSSSPSVFKLYPGFKNELSIEGLVGILLVNFIAGGQTLLKDVRRLGPGRALKWRKGSQAEEVKDEFIIPSDRYFGNSFEKNLEIIDGLFTAAVTKNEIDDPLTLLSGGLDSRLLAGYLEKIFGRRVRAVTQGSSADLEMMCAKRVARALRWDHHFLPADPATFGHYARIKLEREYLAHGFNTPYFMQMAPKIRVLGTTIHSGVHGDAALGCGTMSRVFDPKSDYPFEPYLAHLNHSGLSEEKIRRLIPKDLLKTAIEDVTEKMRALYHSYPGAPFQRAWLYELTVADRMQVGFIPRMLAFGAWPLLPFVDKDLLTAVAGMPYEHIAHRRMEKELVCRKFPALAVLPLDRNNYNTNPLFGLKRLFKRNDLSFSQRATLIAENAKGRLRSTARRMGLAGSKTDRRFYYQTFDINGPAWMDFRKKVEGSRPALTGIFDPQVLSEFWAAPGSAVRVKDGITDTQAFKVLLGFALWAEQNLDRK